jgi:transposase
VGGLEATLFSGWIHDELRLHAAAVKVANPAMLKAIVASKKKNDRVDARKIADALRCDLFPECYMAPGWIRELRCMLRYRNLVVAQAVRVKNRMAGLLMEHGISYDQRRLHGKRYFAELMESLDTPPETLQLLRLSRASLEMFQAVERRLIGELKDNLWLRNRVGLLQSIRGVGEILALTWVLEIGEIERFSSIGRAVSYCGLTSAERESGGKRQRGPLSKQRNRHLQTVVIEAAKVAPRWNPQLAAVYERERERGNANRATLAVARKLVAYLMAVDRSRQPFRPRALDQAATVAPNVG